MSKLTVTDKGTLVRLTPAHPEGWRYYPVFEARVLDWATRLSPWMVPETIRAFLRERWLKMPLSLGCWLYLDEQESPLAHICAYVAVEWGVVSIVVFQVASNEGVIVTDIADDFLAELKGWMGEVNEAYGTQAPPVSVSRVVMYTERDSVWMRYMAKRLPIRRTLTELEWVP